MADDYRPIDTAPRDGTEIELMDPDCGTFIMRWNPGATTFWSKVKDPGLWECPGGNFTWCENDGYGPRYWRPLSSATPISRQ
jgi:hypothetical protein